MAIAEAACCGLSVVSTRVGGVPEVLPESMIRLAAPDPASLIDALEDAIAHVDEVDPWALHAAVRSLYSWDDVAARTEAIYRAAMLHEMPPFIERLRRYCSTGPIAGPLACMIMGASYLYWRWLERVRPVADIELAPDLPFMLGSDDDDDDAEEEDDDDDDDAEEDDDEEEL